MLQQNQGTLMQYIERAKKVLQHEQRTNYQDQAIKPGGLEVFVAIWSEETSKAWREAGIDPTPIMHVREHLQGYRQQDPLLRTHSLRAALAILNDLTVHDTEQNGQSQPPVAITEEESPQTSAASVNPASTKAAKKGRSAARKESVKDPVETEASEIAPPQKRAPAPEYKNQVQLEAGMTPGHVTLTLFRADITAIPGVGPAVAERLHHLGLNTIQDVLFYFPREHRDYSKLEKIGNIPFGEVVSTKGLIWDAQLRRTGGGRAVTMATISDDTGKLILSWFNQPYLVKLLAKNKGDYLVVTGTKQRYGNRIEFMVRSHEFPDQGDLINTGRLVPTYALTEGLHAKALRRFTKWVVDRYAKLVPEHLPQSIRSAGELIPLPEAISQIHYPESEKALQTARRRLAFDELFLIQLGMQERRSRWQREAPEGTAFVVDPRKVFVNPEEEDRISDEPANTPSIADLPGATLWSVEASDQPFEATLPFTFTDAQHRVLREIFTDLARSQPMCRLLQGDVGAGKTAVAAAALFVCALNGQQGAIMAPTELLAEQHAKSISKMLEPFGIRTVLLTGSMRQRERVQARQALERGEATVAIGTHALIQDDVSFQRLGLVIIDEQHRFGVEQRDVLRHKGYHPHMLVMTATPIPRTLALTLYGDLDVSVIDKLPPGRQKIITRWRTGARRAESYTTITHQVAEGRQAFIICPLIEESETLTAKAATVEYERLQREVFPNLRLGLLHGAMKAAEKDQTMHRFRDRELDILVATSVIEVGIDIPNATVMVIEDADRFGLSQLHQFRGRVGRGKHQSFCYVLSADATVQAQERLGVFQEADDGFLLAQEDLRLRGPGDFFGVRQSGTPELRIADLSDIQLINLTRELAEKLWESDPYLRRAEHSALRERMYLFWQNFVGH
jgi:ATP-dependent DNA helicase RecG